MSDTQRIAEAAARMVVEEGLDYAGAKRKALKRLGGSSRTALPSNEVVEDAVRDYLSVFCADTQPAQLRALRALALQWMRRLQAFRPLIGGAVWRGTATQHSDIYLDLYCDDPKSAPFALLDQRLDHEVTTRQNAQGEDIVVLSVLAMMHNEFFPPHHGVWVHLSLLERDAVRGALRLDARGVPLHGDTDALAALLDPSP